MARIFTLCKPTLLTVPWFARAYTWVSGVRARAVSFLKATPAWKATQALAAAVRGVFRASSEGQPGLLARLWRSARQQIRRD